MKVSELEIGQPFEVAGCKETIRGLVLLRKSKTAAFVSAEERDDIKSPWNRRKTYVALGTEVEIDPKRALIKVGRNSRGELVIDNGELVMVDVPNESAITSSGKLKPHKMARKVKIVFPTGEFKIPEVAQELGVSTTSVYAVVVKRVKEKTMTFREERKKGAKGRATRIYKVVKNAND